MVRGRGVAGHGLAQPDGAESPRQAGSGAGSGPIGSGYGGREVRPAWYIAVGATAVVLVGVGTAAFLAGGGGTDQPGPRVTPAVDTYVMQHDLMDGVAPVTSSRYGPPASKNFSSHAP